MALRLRYEQRIANPGDVLVKRGTMAATDRTGPVARGPLVGLHVFILMHRSSLKLPDEQLGPLRGAVREDRNAQEGRRSRREHQQTDRMQGDGVRDGFDAATHREPRTLADPELLAGPLEVNREGRLASLS